MGIDQGETFTATELFTGAAYRWQGSSQRLRLDPNHYPAAVFRIER
jgi:hypothetical protein